MAQAKDVVCGMIIDNESTQHKSEYKGETYYFCVPGCKKAFDKEPEKYLHQEESSHAGHGHH